MIYNREAHAQVLWRGYNPTITPHAHRTPPALPTHPAIPIFSAPPQHSALPTLPAHPPPPSFRGLHSSRAPRFFPQSTYCEHLWNHCQTIGRPVHCVNLGAL